MASSMTTRDGDVADAIALAAYGYTDGATEALIAANPVLSRHRPVLPAGLNLTLPDILPPSPATVTLWD